MYKIKAECVGYINYGSRSDDFLSIGREYNIIPFVTKCGETMYEIYDCVNNDCLIILNKYGMQNGFTMSPIRNSIIDKILDDN